MYTCKYFNTLVYAFSFTFKHTYTIKNAYVHSYTNVEIDTHAHKHICKLLKYTQVHILINTYSHKVAKLRFIQSLSEESMPTRLNIPRELTPTYNERLNGIAYSTNLYQTHLPCLGLG